METFRMMLSLQGMLFLLIMCGIILRKINILPTVSRQYLSDLLISFILPCSIISSFNITLTKEILASCGLILLLASCSQLYTYVLSKLLYNRFPAGQQVIMRYGTICSNAGFLGIPIVGGVYGAQGLLLVSIALIPIRVVLWSAGISHFTTITPKTAAKTILTHPCIVAILIGFCVTLCPWELPDIIARTLDTAGSCNTAIAMIVIGGILSEIRLRGVMTKTIAYYTFIRLIGVPISLLLILRLLHLDPMISGIIVLLAGMPAGSTAAILAEKYGADSEFAAKIVFVTTALSLITLPLLCLLL